MKNLIHPRRTAAFTLIELLIAVSLLIMLMVAIGFIFGITGGAISESQAVNEMSASLAGFYNVLRDDVRGADNGGVMIIGKRDMSSYGKKIYGNRRRQEREREEQTRCDWMVLMTNTEQSSPVDSGMIGQYARILYGHGRKTDTTSGSGATWSPYTTEWMLVRHQYLVVWAMPFNVSEVEVPGDAPGWMGETTRSYAVAGIDRSGDQNNWNNWAKRTLAGYTNRDFRWHHYGAGEGNGGYAWDGTVLTPTYNYLGSPAKAIYEPDYWQRFAYHVSHFATQEGARFGVLPHCAEFRVQYARASDLRAANGSIRWQDPPAKGQSGYHDPNSRGDSKDEFHKYSEIPASGDYSGRLCFGPGDDWPVLMKFTIRIYDAEERIEQDKTLTEIIPLAR